MPELREDDLQTWASLATLLEWLPAALDAQLLRDAGLTHFEYGLLYALLHAPDRTLRMSTLAGYANSSLSRLSRAAARLEAKDLLRRAPDPADGRYTLAILTPRGQSEAEAAGPGHRALVGRLVFDNLSVAQTRQLREISTRITAAIRADGGWSPTTGGR